MISNGQVLGRWKNSKGETKGIAAFSLEEVQGKLMITIEGAADGHLPSKIGPVEAIAHGADLTSTACSAFQARTESNGKSYFFAGNINKGLIIIATYVEVPLELGSNFFIREFFYKLK